MKTFGESPYLKVLDFFLNYPDFDYSKTYVAEQAGISRITIEGVWLELVKNKVIVKTRTLGRAELFKLNVNDPVVQKLLKIDFELAEAHNKKAVAVARA
ncbi:MAG: hypothetical protein V1834_01225 [Candidatus Micrarchaeota archaeon]